MKKKLTIRNKMILLTILIVSCALVVSGVYFFVNYFSTLQKDAYDKLNASIDQVTTSLSTRIDSIENATFAFSSSEYIRDWKNRDLDFQSDGDTYLRVANLRREIETNLMFNTAWVSKYIDTVYFQADGSLFNLVARKTVNFTQVDKQNQKVYDATLGYKEMSFYYLDQNGGSPIVYFVRRMNDISMTKTLTFILTVNTEGISEELQQLGENITAHVVRDGVIYFSSSPEMVGSQVQTSDDTGAAALSTGQSRLQDEGTYYYVQRPLGLEESDFIISVAVPRDSITQPLFTSMKDFIIVTFILLILFSLIAGFTTGAYTRFIKDLTDGLNQVRKNNYEVTLPKYRDMQLNGISDTFNSMTSEIQTLINTVYKSELLLKEADIKLLQSQMNPHFLINTLTTISTTALMQGDERTYEMVTALSSMLDSSLYNNGSNTSLIPVYKELEYINCYLYLQQIRFQDKLQYSIDIEEPELRDMYIPRLSIEPLVENSVVHGVEDNISAGVVTVTIRRDGETLLAVITDNGKGFDVEKVLKEKKSTKERGHHIGINNTDRRIKLLFGEEYGIRFESEPGMGTTAFIRFPVLWSPGEKRGT